MFSKPPQFLRNSTELKRVRRVLQCMQGALNEEPDVLILFNLDIFSVFYILRTYPTPSTGNFWFNGTLGGNI